MKNRVKIKDIAQKAGVSPATVSRALSDPDLVAEPTLSRVLEAVRQLNYRPNAVARNLRMQKSMAILLVVRDVALETSSAHLRDHAGGEVGAGSGGFRGQGGDGSQPSR